MCSGFPHPAAPGRWVHATRREDARRRRDRAGGGGPSAGDYRHSILSTELLEPMNYRREGIPKEACSGRAPGEGALTRILGARSTSSPQRGGSVSERGRAPRTARVASGAPDLRLLGAVVKIETVQCNTLIWDWEGLSRHNLVPRRWSKAGETKAKRSHA